MSTTTTIIRTPEVLREMAIELKLSLDCVLLSDHEDGTQRATFEFITLDFDYEVSFDFDVTYFEGGDEDVSKIANIKDLVSVYMLDLSHGDSRSLDESLQSMTKEQLILLVKKFMGLEWDD